MKTLVVFYSRDGHTKAVAQEIAKTLGADLEEIVDKKSRQGIIGWLLGGRDATKKRDTEIGPLKCDPAAYELVAIGTPIWAWNMAPAVRTYLTQNKGKVKSAAFFCTQGGSGGEKTFGYMEEILGLKPKATLELNAKELAGPDKDRKTAEFVSKLK
jgi:flavodoxin